MSAAYSFAGCHLCFTGSSGLPTTSGNQPFIGFPEVRRALERRPVPFPSRLFSPEKRTQLAWKHVLASNC
jgi:hypothetical protein